MPPAGAMSLGGAAPLAVIDTNVWLDLYVFGDARAAPLAQALAEGRLRALRSVRTDDELARVLERPVFAQRAGAAAHAAHLAAWQSSACLLEAEPGPAPWICRDPQDQKFLDLACAAQALWLLTKDRALLDLAPVARRAGLRIATPEGFYAE
jgi:putative PIN family toxin of toxin-antitoxin system